MTYDAVTSDGIGREQAGGEVGKGGREADAAGGGADRGFGERAGVVGRGAHFGVSGPGWGWRGRHAAREQYTDRVRDVFEPGVGDDGTDGVEHNDHQLSVFERERGWDAGFHSAERDEPGV